jgi:hypothetical protein
VVLQLKYTSLLTHENRTIVQTGQVGARTDDSAPRGGRPPDSRRYLPRTRVAIIYSESDESIACGETPARVRALASSALTTVAIGLILVARSDRVHVADQDPDIGDRNSSLVDKDDV